MKKRVVSLRLVIAFMVSTIFTGCGSESSAASDPNTIVIWHDKEEAVANVLQEQLNVLNPEITVVLEKKSDLTESLKIVGNDPKSAPDMYIFAHDKIGVYAEMGILSPITDMIPLEELDAYMDKTIQAVTYKGEIYQLPIYYETLLFMYNRLYMKDDEVPTTTEELYTYMTENTVGGHYGFVEQHSTPYYAAGWINGFGGDILDEEGHACLNSQAVIDALIYHKKFVDLMPGETEYATVNTLFSSGMAHATIAGPWMIPTVKEKGMDVGVAAMPTIQKAGRPIAPYMGVQGVQVLKNAAKKKPEAVEKVLRILMDPQVEVSLAKASGCAPANESCYEREEIKKDDVVMMMKQTADNAVPMSNRPEMDAMWMVLGNLLTDVNLSGKDIEESVEAAQAKAESLIQSMQ